MDRRRSAKGSATPIADLIAAAVRDAVVARLTAAHEPRRRAFPRRAARAADAPAPTPAPSTSAAPAPTADLAAERAARAASAQAAAHRAENELLDNVRRELAICYDGKPVSPARLAALLKTDVILVEATLNFLASRREARASRVRGRVGFIPMHPAAR